MKTVWGIDLGGTKIEVAVLKHADQTEVIQRMRIPTEGDKGYQHVLNQIRKLVDQMISVTGYKPENIGMGIPGCIDKKTGEVKNSNTVCLIGNPIDKDLGNLLGIPVITANDANCFALAEARYGIVHENYPEAEVIFGVIMGTGVGGGIVMDGKVINGLHGIAGEWGHNFLDASGGLCYCGKTGCVETLISGPALEKHYHSISGREMKLPEIYEYAITGNDPSASRTISRMLEYFGKAIAVVINILDPDVIVLGGGLGNMDILYSQGPDEIKKHLFNNTIKTPLLKPKLGDSAGVFGAAALVAHL